MSHLAIMRARTPASTIGDVPFLSTIVNDVEASARAQLYQQLADFQAIPQRVNRVAQQLSLFTVSAPTRSATESAALAAIQTGLSTLQGQWSSTNATVNGAIAAVSGGSGALDVASSVAQAIAGMTLAAQGIGVLEQQARALVSNSTALSDTQRASILAAGAPFAFDIVTLAKWGLGAFVAYKIFKALR